MKRQDMISELTSLDRATLQLVQAKARDQSLSLYRTMRRSQLQEIKVYRRADRAHRYIKHIQAEMIEFRKHFLAP